MRLAFFHGPSAQRMAQARLLALYRAKKVDRHYQHGRDNVWVPTRSKGGNVPHMLAVAQGWIDAGMPSDFEREYVVGHVRADALFWIGRTPYFLEVERSHNSLARKIEGYQALWRDHGTWQEQFASFPFLLVVVPSPAHVERAESIPSPPKAVCTASQLAQVVSSTFTRARSSP